MSVQGSCHCGKIAFTLDADPAEAMECNCSICRRKGYLLAFYPPEKFSLETARDAIAVYTFNACHPASILQGLRLRALWRGGGIRRKKYDRSKSACVPDVDLKALNISHFDGASL